MWCSRVCISSQDFLDRRLLPTRQSIETGIPSGEVEDVHSQICMVAIVTWLNVTECLCLWICFFYRTSNLSTPCLWFISVYLTWVWQEVPLIWCGCLPFRSACVRSRCKWGLWGKCSLIDHCWPFRLFLSFVAIVLSVLWFSHFTYFL